MVMVLGGRKESKEIQCGFRDIIYVPTYGRAPGHTYLCYLGSKEARLFCFVLV